MPFCRACRAPQIRVVGIEPRPETVAVPHPAAEDLPIPAVAPGADAARIRWSQDLPYSVSQFSGRGYDPDKIQQTLELLKTPQGLSLFVGFVLFIMCVIFIVGASIGGAWYSAWVRKRLRR